MNWRVISASVRGSSHRRSGAPNQDAVDYATGKKSEPSATVLAVSDGHGGGRHFRSQVGSTLAVHVAVTIVHDYIVQPTGTAPPLAQLSLAVVEAWSKSVLSDLANNPFTEGELAALGEGDGASVRDAVLERPELAYGATLLVAAVTDARIIYLQLGDGDILAVGADGTTVRPIASDERLVGNQTTSLCQPDAWREFRTADVSANSGLPVLVLISTDGYVNSFRSQEDFLQIGRDYLQMLQEQGSEALAEELPKILTEATQQGSGDDITLGMLYAEVIPAAIVGGNAPSSVQAAATPSVIIRALKQERSTHQKKLTELESNYEGVRKHVLQLRLLVTAAFLVVLALLTQQFWLPIFHTASGKKPSEPVVSAGAQKKPSKGAPEDDKGGPIKDPLLPPAPSPGNEPRDTPSTGTPAAGGSPEKSEQQWMLVLGNGKELALTVGKTISFSDLVAREDKRPYAKVKKLDDTLMLTNLSTDVWIASSPASSKKLTFANGDSVPLRPETSITFRKSVSGSVSLRNTSS